MRKDVLQGAAFFLMLGAAAAVESSFPVAFGMAGAAAVLVLVSERVR